jgi:hypothetical protein
VDKMLAAGRITADEAERIRAAATQGDVDQAVAEIRRRHALEWAATAVGDARLSDDEAADLVAAVERGESPKIIRRPLGSGG